MPTDAATVLLLHFDGANGATATIDSSPSAKAITRTGTVAISTAQSKFGGSCTTSGAAAGNFWSAADHADWHFGAGAFCIEAWIYLTASPDTTNNKIIDQWGGGSNGWWFGFASADMPQFYYSTTGANFATVDGAWTPTLNTWHHVCVERDGSNVVRIFANGAVVGSATVAATFFNSTAPLEIAGDNGDTWAGIIGFVDEVRISKGVTRYGAAFTPPAAAFTAGGRGRRRMGLRLGGF